MLSLFMDDYKDDVGRMEKKVEYKKITSLTLSS